MGLVSVADLRPQCEQSCSEAVPLGKLYGIYVIAVLYLWKVSVGE